MSEDVKLSSLLLRVDSISDQREVGLISLASSTNILHRLGAPPDGDVLSLVEVRENGKSPIDSESGRTHQYLLGSRFENVHSMWQIDLDGLFIIRQRVHGDTLELLRMSNHPGIFRLNLS